MRLSDATVAIRPRSSWEAMDLGVLMSQQHRRLLMTSWAIVTLPLFAMLTLLLWDSPSLAVLIFWWLKPAYERLPLYILSKALFGETPTLKQALREFPRLLKPQLLASLTWRRLSLSRSFLLPVVQLEGLDGTARQQRLQVLLQRNAGAAQWLTIIGMHLETALWIGLMVLFYMLLPQQIETDWDWQSLILDSDHHWRWLEHLTNAFCAGTGGLGTGVCRLRFQPVSEPPHCTGSLGHRTGVPPFAPAPERQRSGPAVGRLSMVADSAAGVGECAGQRPEAPAC
jgi:hypothetical protein